MRVLVLGGGAREHALLWKLRQSPLVSALFVAPGNAGMGDVAERLTPAESTIEAFAELARSNRIDLTVVGPEDLLVAGLVDHFRSKGLRVFGPTAAAARLEGSKTWARDVMQRVGIPTASWRVFTNKGEARAHAESLGWRCVVKADGLAAGKGAFVCETSNEVDEALDLMLGQHIYGEMPVIVEEFLDGQEVSVFAISDGRTVVPFGAAQDHKRALDGDEGPNTGGMGAYSPVNHMQIAQGFAESFFKPIIDDMAALGSPYVGVIYAGAIVTQQGPKILEFNCRFGDPEAEVLLSRLTDDLADLLWAATEGELHARSTPTWDDDHEALCVVISTEAYPGGKDMGTPIYGLLEVEALPDVVVFHAGTEIEPATQRVVTNGGRILCVTALGKDVSEARKRAYEAIDLIHFDGMFYRKDIGVKAMTEAFRSEWRKPPTWERHMMYISRAITDVARDVQSLQGAEVREADLEELKKRLFRLKLTLQPEGTPLPRYGRRVPTPSPDRLRSLNDEFDEILDRMQTPAVRAGIDAGFHAAPSTLNVIVGERASHRKPD